MHRLDRLLDPFEVARELGDEVDQVGVAVDHPVVGGGNNLTPSFKPFTFAGPLGNLRIEAPDADEAAEIASFSGELKKEGDVYASDLVGISTTTSTATTGYQFADEQCLHSREDLGLLGGEGSWFQRP